jgi:hypothetical protein
MCYGVSQPAGARCRWMRRWRPWTTDFFNANLSLFHRDHVCTTHRLLHLLRLSGAGTACTTPSRVLRATARGDWHPSWMASTPSSVSNKNNECGNVNVNIFNISHFQNNFYLPQSTPTGNERCQHLCWWTWRRDEQRGALLNLRASW